jgi:hypothetical protein
MGGGLADAPSDGSTYGRKNAAWVVVSGTGTVTGPGSSTDGHIVLFDGTTGQLLKDGGALTTSIVPEGSNLYFTNARAIGATLTGFTAATSSSAIAAADSVLAALQKVEYRLALDDAKVTFPGFSAATPSASTTSGSVGTDTKPPHADHSHPLPKVTLAACWYFQTISTSDPQPCFEIRAACTLKGIRAFQDSGASSFGSACAITLYKNGTSWKTLTMPTTWTSGTWVSILSSLSDALVVGDFLQAKVTTTGTGYSQIMIEAEIEQVAHA